MPCLALAMIWAVLAAQTPTEDTDWQPITAEEAHLIVSPAVFGGDDVERSVNADPAGVGRQERWRVRFHDLGRFVLIVLRESVPPDPEDPAEPDAVRRMVLDAYPAAEGSIRWGDTETVATGLGSAEVQTFNLAGFGCAAFIIRFGAPAGTVQPNRVEGSYCDPATAELPANDIAAALNAIGVRGVYEPQTTSTPP